MEPLFMMETVMTEELYMRFNRVHFKSNKMRWVLLIPSILFIPLGIQFLFVLHNLLAGIMMLMFGILFPFLLKISLDNSVKVMKRNSQGIFGLPYTIAFYEGEYVEYSPRGEMHTPYGIMYKIVETEELLFLYQNKMAANIVDKSKMTKGTAEEITAFLRVRCPVPYRYAGK